jgi:predicted nucleic acid-binding protein
MGTVVLDAGVVIAVFDKADAHHPAAMTALAAARGDAFVLPASAYAEMLVLPHRLGADAVLAADAFVDDLPARVEPVTRPIAALAAALRARFGPALKLPDALVVATAEVVGADRILTTDPRLRGHHVSVQQVGEAR